MPHFFRCSFFSFSTSTCTIFSFCSTQLTVPFSFIPSFICSYISSSTFLSFLVSIVATYFLCSVQLPQILTLNFCCRRLRIDSDEFLPRFFCFVFFFSFLLLLEAPSGSYCSKCRFLFCRFFLLIRWAQNIFVSNVTTASTCFYGINSKIIGNLRKLLIFLLSIFYFFFGSGILFWNILSVHFCRLN